VIQRVTICPYSVFISNVAPPQKSQIPINNGELTVVATVKPSDAPPERGGIKGNTDDTLLPQTSEIGFRRINAANIVIEQVDPDTTLAGFPQKGCQTETGLVGMDDVILKTNC
jgi:hypothetical protein